MLLGYYSRMLLRVCHYHGEFRIDLIDQGPLSLLEVLLLGACDSSVKA